MLSNMLLAGAFLTSTVIAAPSEATTTADYTIVPIYRTSSSSSALSTVYVTTTIGVTSSAVTSDTLSYSVVPIEGFSPATTVTVYKSGSTLWTGTSSAPLGTGTGKPVANSTSSIVVSAGASVGRSGLAVAVGAIGAAMAAF